MRVTDSLTTWDAGIILMYDIAIKRADDRQARQVFKVSGGTLADVERFVVGVLQVQFDSRSIVLVYDDDLIYHVYDDNVFVGIVEIRLDG